MFYVLFCLFLHRFWCGWARDFYATRDSKSAAQGWESKWDELSEEKKKKYYDMAYESSATSPLTIAISG
jgi:hypothetical protein